MSLVVYVHTQTYCVPCTVFTCYSILMLIHSLVTSVLLFSSGYIIHTPYGWYPWIFCDSLSSKGFGRATYWQWGITITHCFWILKITMMGWAHWLDITFQQNNLIIWFLQPKEMAGFLVLLNQLICKFGTSVRDILEDVYPVVAGRIFIVIPRDGLPSCPGAVTEVFVWLFCLTQCINNHHAWLGNLLIW